MFLGCNQVSKIPCIRTPKLKKVCSPGSKLKVAWVIGDLCPHPVSRFIYQFFAGSQNHEFRHDHILVNTYNHGKESCKSWFEGLSNLPIVDVSSHKAEKRVAAIRSLDVDVALDLSGWTSNHFLAGFMARLAPIQINYLGYFASGLTEMDYWLGDRNLFPSPMKEWCSEQIFCLNRPFLAWKPVTPLPEAEASISDAPRGIPSGSDSFQPIIARCRIRRYHSVGQEFCTGNS